jgi:hypothetical protein
MIGETISAIIELFIKGIGRFNNRIVVIIRSQHGMLVRRRNVYAIVVGDVKAPQYIVKTSKAYADKLTIMELDNKIDEIVNNVENYQQALMLNI